MSATDRGLDTGTERAIELFLEDWLVEEEIPGASVAVFDEDSPLYATSLGSRTLDGTEPATPETLYNVGSITKIVTAIAVFQLIERDGLDLDDEIRDYVPFLHEAPGDPITVRELLTHSSGMPSDTIFERDNAATETDLRLHADAAADQRITDGSRFMYYNTGYKILGQLVAAVDGRDYAEYVGDEIFSPLRMDRSTFDQRVLQSESDAMTGYRVEDGERIPVDEPLDFESGLADGALISPVTELTRLLRCVLGDGTLDGARLLAPETIEAMREQQQHRTSTIDGQDRWYGHGLMIEEFLDDRLVGHGGLVEHAQAYAGGFRDRELGVAVACNRSEVPIWAIAMGILATAAGESPVDVVPEIALREKIRAVTGRYESFRGPSASVERAGGYITVEIEEWGQEFPAFPESLAADEYAFYTVEPNGHRTPVEFREIDGDLTMLWGPGRFTRTG
jgi:CubicO group peptidase (beta-lactamase class C family)